MTDELFVRYSYKVYTEEGGTIACGGRVRDRVVTTFTDWCVLYVEDTDTKERALYSLECDLREEHGQVDILSVNKI